jgi:hypothetical protein
MGIVLLDLGVCVINLDVQLGGLNHLHIELGLERLSFCFRFSCFFGGFCGFGSTAAGSLEVFSHEIFLYFSLLPS